MKQGILIFILGAAIVGCAYLLNQKAKHHQFTKCVEYFGGGDDAYCGCSITVYNDYNCY